MKKILVLLVSLIAIFGFVSCNGENTSPSYPAIDEEVYNAILGCFDSIMDEEPESYTYKSSVELYDDSNNLLCAVVWENGEYNDKDEYEKYNEYMESGYNGVALITSIEEGKYEYSDVVYSTSSEMSANYTTGIVTTSSQISYTSSNEILEGSGIYEFEILLYVTVGYTAEGVASVDVERFLITYNGVTYDASDLLNVSDF